MTVSNPEVYHLPPTPSVPNSKLPVLVYRDVLPRPHNEDSTSEFLQSHRWKKGGTWGTYPTHHFHPNTHECYGVFQGSSTLLLGRGPHDDEDGTGVLIPMRAGDVIVLPAGVAHCTAPTPAGENEQGDAYRYIGVYPEGAPHWRSMYGRPGEDTAALKKEAAAVPLPPCDPVSGENGPVMKLWEATLSK